MLFDDDTRLLFATSFDGPWDASMVDFASTPLKLFDSIFCHVEGYEGLPDLAAVKGFILSAQQGRVARPGRRTCSAATCPRAGHPCRAPPGVALLGRRPLAPNRRRASP